MDTKIDDGRPAYGAIVVPEFQVACHTDSDPAVSEYDVQSTSEGCALIRIFR